MLDGCWFLIEQYKGNVKETAENILVVFWRECYPGLGARVGVLKLPVDIYYKTITRIRGLEHRVEVFGVRT